MIPKHSAPSQTIKNVSKTIDTGLMVTKLLSMLDITTVFVWLTVALALMSTTLKLWYGI